jgi:hypothetical protein
MTAPRIDIRTHVGFPEILGANAMALFRVGA